MLRVKQNRGFILALTLGIMVIMGGVAVQSASAEQALERAQEITHWVLTDRFDDIVAAFAPELAAQASGEQLQMAWASLPIQFGDIAEIGDAYVAQTEPFIFIRTPIHFARATLDLLYAFDAELRLATFAFVPHEPRAVQTAPYVDPTRFTEHTLGFGVEGYPLEGTLTLPTGNGPHPAVVLVHGSGPHDRDETIGPNKPFRDLAWGLASQGIAVFRYDKRTAVHATRMAEEEDLTVDHEVIDDAVEAVRLLTKRDDIDRVFVLGHSLGGMLAPYIGQAAPEVSGLILMAANARPLSTLLIEQLDYLLGGGAQLGTEEALQETKREAERLIAGDLDDVEMLMGTPTGYWIDLESRDQVAVAKDLTVPILVLQGGRDYQVTMVDYELWKQALEDQGHATFHSYPNLNHVFLGGEGPSTPEEYMQAGFVAPEVVMDIASWVLEVK